MLLSNLLQGNMQVVRDIQSQESTAKTILTCERGLT